VGRTFVDMTDRIGPHDYLQTIHHPLLSDLDVFSRNLYQVAVDLQLKRITLLQ
jgi:hypothetical protein